MPNEVGTITVRAVFDQVKKATDALRKMGRQADKTEDQVDKATKSTKRMNKAAKGLGRTVGKIAAGVSVGLFARKVIANTKEQEQAIAAVNNTLRSTGRYSDEASAALQRQAAAFQKLTTYGDEEILRGQELLLTFKKIGGEVFPQTTEAMLNLATKMGTDLKSAALQVGKALEDPATQMTYLVRSGISFTEEQKKMAREMQRSGNLAGAQKIVLEELEKQFGGTARAARDTFGGALSAVSNAFNDLLEGDKDSIQGATTALNELEKTLQSPQLEEGFQKLIGATVTVVEWSAKAAAGIANVTTEVGEFFGELLNGPEFTTIDEVTARIAQVEQEINSAADAWFDFSGGEYVSTREQELLGLRLQLELLQKQAKDGVEVKTDVDPLDETIPFATPEDPDSLLITLDNDELKKKIAQMQAEVERDFRVMGQTAGQELSEALAETTAELGGPISEANLEYARTLEEIDTWQRQLYESGQLTAERQKELNQLRENAAELNQMEVDQIQERIRAKEEELTPTERLLESLQLELDLLKLGAEEREREIVQRQLAGEATEEQLAAIDALIMKRQEAQSAIESLDEIRGATKGFLTDLGSGSKSVGDAFDRMFDRIKQRALDLAAEKLIEKIFGAMGTAGSGGGDAGGGIFGLIAGAFAGGRALGGPVSPRRIYEVNENGPELLTVGDRNYLLAGDRGGMVNPLNQVTNNNNQTRQVWNINLPPTIPRKTADQVAGEVNRRNRRVTARNS